MVPISRDSRSCKYRAKNRCSNLQIASNPIVDDSLQSRWYCSNCKYFEPQAPGLLAPDVSD